MTLLSFYGGMMAAYGPSLLLFTSVVMRKAQLVVVMIAAAFFMLLAVLGASVAWAGLRHVVSADWVYVLLAVLVQEAVRVWFFRLYRVAEMSFSVVSTNAVVFPLTDLMSAVAAGLGFGIVQTMMIYGSVLSSAMGPGALFSPKCDHWSSVFQGALQSNMFVFIHIALMIIAFDAMRRASIEKMAAFVLLHLLASSITVMNKSENGCVASLVLLFVAMLGTLGYAWWVMHRPDYRSKLHLR
eukprot:TRINITY_DN84977_c0_g1_i1.p1 TRINITY_DN84977_c0_g1~~TRINITY_DN84977_c0_g1_i1.p1  ORF type:complete len:241 (-),score=101.02 TRINITY_DN84977_c0_g1_i1:11-733(-)